MPKNPSDPVSLGDIARAAGVSRVTACYVMRNHSGPSPKTRERILKIAQRLGYTPDARISSWMAKVRETKKKDLLPIAWLNTHSDKDAWGRYDFLSPYLRGASGRARQLGYHIENIWAHQDAMPMRRVSQIVRQRGIEGVIITHPVRHFHLAWNSVAAVSLEGSLLAPRLHHVMSDTNFNLLLAWKTLKRSGRGQIGICLQEEIDRFSHHMIRSTVQFLYRTTSPGDRIRPLLLSHHTTDEAKRKATVEWIKKEKPKVVIGHDSRLVQWIKDAGYHIPQDIGVVHIATDDDVNDWAGISSRREQVGAYAAEWVISLLQNRRFGVPETAVNMAIRGAWHEGWTLSNKPKK